MTHSSAFEPQPAAPNRRVHPFDRSGIARVSDLNTTGWLEVYRRLEGDQAEFLARESLFRSELYPWPRDPLHTWSRVWEYPYVFHHLTRRVSVPRTEVTRIVDFGSGVTFFPFALAKHGYAVTCVDNDPVVATDLAKAVASVPHSPGTVDFATATERLPFEAASVDALYSISVLEHMPDPRAIIPEIARVLVPGGVFVLTIDLDLRGDTAIGKDAYESLVAALEELFVYSCPVTTTHPADVLDNSRGPFRTPVREGLSGRWWDLKQSIKPFLGRTRSSELPYHLAVEGFVLKKRTAI